jgi:DNA-binding response OmpR family regulator
VDDDPHYLDILPRALNKIGNYEIITASTGFDAGTMVAERNPRVLILDINLSDMDGRKVCQRVKGRPETQHTRVLAISGFIEAHEFPGLKDFGFDDYLRKPFTLEEMIAKVQTLLRLPDTKVARPVAASS